MSDIKVVILTRAGLDTTEIVRVFDSVEAFEGYVVALVRQNKMDDLNGLKMSTHIVYGGSHGNSKLYTRHSDTGNIGDLQYVEKTKS